MHCSWPQNSAVYGHPGCVMKTRPCPTRFPQPLHLALIKAVLPKVMQHEHPAALDLLLAVRNLRREGQAGGEDGRAEARARQQLLLKGLESIARIALQAAVLGVTSNTPAVPTPSPAPEKPRPPTMAFRDSSLLFSCSSGDLFSSADWRSMCRDFAASAYE